VGEIVRIDRSSKAYDYYIKVPEKYIRLIPPKGSVAVDGISLTVNESLEDSFRLTIIPHTLQTTLFGDYKVGRRVNIETDVLARYIAHIFAPKKSLTWDEVEKIQALY
jgi:riboflavin synthase